MNRQFARSVEGRLWLAVFLYSLAAGLAVQLIVLPYLFPQIHAGNGLLAGRDWVGFHEQAVLEAQRIAKYGWIEYKFRPDGDNAIIGVTSLLYAVFGYHPWVLLPLNSAVFAVGGVALYKLLMRIGLREGDAKLAILPYVLFPSALIQYAQIHKDIFCTVGVLVVLYSWTSIVNSKLTFQKYLTSVFIFSAGLFLIWIFRPYLMIPVALFGAVILGALLIIALWPMVKGIFYGFANERMHWWSPIHFSVLAGTATFLVTLVFSSTIFDFGFYTAGDDGTLTLPVFSIKSNREVRSADATRIIRLDDKLDEKSQDYAQRAAEAAVREAEAIKAVEECRPVVILRPDAVIENAINRAFLKIAVARAGFTSSGGQTAATNIDKDINFCRNVDLVNYIPRAIQIALFAPFPASWVRLENRNSSSVEVYISAVETFYSYVAMFGLLFWMFAWRRINLSFAVIVLFVAGMMLLLGLTVANIGTLYRMRFPYMMILIGMGMAGLLQVFRSNSNRE